MLLHVAELLEAPVAVGALVGLLSGVDADVLHQLVVGGERLETLLALVRLRLAAVHLPRVQLHRRLVHEDLQHQTGTRSEGYGEISRPINTGMLCFAQSN